MKNKNMNINIKVIFISAKSLFFSKFQNARGGKEMKRLLNQF